MKIWKILSPKVLTAEERPDNLTSDTQAKVKVTQLLLSGTELRAYTGNPKPKYPFVPGRFAVGVVGEAGSACIKVEKIRAYSFTIPFPAAGANAASRATPIPAATCRYPASTPKGICATSS